jgi:predicted nucleic acid-binding protein
MASIPPHGLVDTDVLIDASRRVEAAVSLLSALWEGGSLSISVISAMELVCGCADGNEMARLREFLERTTLVPVSSAVSMTAYRLMQAFYLSHGLRIPDALIAATALELKQPLYTRNIRHFAMIPELKVVRPY